MVTLRVGIRLALSAAWAGSTGRDAVADGDLLGADEDVFDEQPQHALAFFGAGGGVAAQLGEEAFEVIGELEVGVAVGELGVQGAELASLAGAQVRHPGAQLADGDQLLGVGLDHRGDPGARPGQAELQVLALPGGRVGGAGPLEPLGDLGADQGGVGEQGGDVVPDPPRVLMRA